MVPEPDTDKGTEKGYPILTKRINCFQHQRTRSWTHERFRCPQVSLSKTGHKRKVSGYSLIYSMKEGINPWKETQPIRMLIPATI